MLHHKWAFLLWARIHSLPNTKHFLTQISLMQYKTQSDQPILVFLYQANKCNLRYTLDF